MMSMKPSQVQAMLSLSFIYNNSPFGRFHTQCRGTVTLAVMTLFLATMTYLGNPLVVMECNGDLRQSDRAIR
jgi:hypothetical protein